MNIIIGKSDISALGCEGCKKKFICNIANNDPDKTRKTKKEIEAKLTTIVPEKDSPAIIDNSGGEGEKGILLYLVSQGKTVVTMDEGDAIFAGKYRHPSLGVEYMRMDNTNISMLQMERSEDIGNAQYTTKTKNEIDNIRECAKLGENYLYQVSIEPNFMDIALKLDPSIQSIYLSNTISVSKQNSMRPDLIEIIQPSSGIPVLDSNFERKDSDGAKYILKVHDIKTSEFTSGFFFELAYYMMLLKGWIDRQGLNNDFEVAYEASILPYDVVSGEIRAREGWNMEFSLVREKVFNILNVQIPAIINGINTGDKSLIETVKRSPRCQVCDYYGEQFEGKLYESFVKKGVTGKTDYKNFIEDPNNNFCRYCLPAKNDINILPSIKTSDINYLQSKGINDISSLQTEIVSGTSIRDNTGIMSNSESLTSEISVHGTGNIVPKVTATRSLAKTRAQLQLYTLIRQDSQRRTLSYGISYSVNVYNVDTSTVKPGMNVNASGTLTENNYSTPYIVEIDKPDIENKLTALIDYILKIREILYSYSGVQYDYYGNKKNVAYGIFYWGKKTYDAFRDNLQDLLSYIANKGGISGLYPTYSAAAITRKENAVKEAINDFAGLFSDDEVTYHERIEKSPLFDLKSIYSELAAIDTNFSYNLMDVYNAVFSTNDLNYHYRPDSDNYSVYTYDYWFSIDRATDPMKKSAYQTELMNKDKQHFYYLSKLYAYLYDSSGSLSGIMKSGELATLGMQRENTGIRDLHLLAIYFFQKMNAAYDKVEIEENHTAPDMKKQYGGDSIYLLNELTPAELTRHGIVKTPFERVYWSESTVENANLDESSFGLTIFPSSKFEDTYKKVTDNPRYTSCLNVGTTLERWQNFKPYTEVVKCDISSFDATNRIIKLKFDPSVLSIMSDLESNYGYDFSHDLYVEKTFMDFWSRRLKDTIKELQKRAYVNRAQILLSPSLQHEFSDSVNNVETELQSSIMTGGPLELDLSQLHAVTTMHNDSLSLLWGPPGTGKSHTLGHLVLLELLRRTDCKVLLMGNYTPTDNLISSLLKIIDKYAIDPTIRQKLDIVRLHSNTKVLEPIKNVHGISEREWKPTDGKLNIIRPFTIISSTPDQLARLADSTSNIKNNLSAIDTFDIVIIDEASQMDVGHFLPALLRVSASQTSHAKIVIAGDDKQLQPIRKEEIKGEDSTWFGSIYNYFRDYEVSPGIKLITPVSLDISRRSNHCIIDLIRHAFGYRPSFVSYNQFSKIEFDKIKYSSKFFEEILDPDDGMILLEYDDGLSSQKNSFEMEEIAKIVKEVWSYGFKRFPGDFRKFFDEGVGIVVPHTAQRTAVRKKLYDEFRRMLPLGYTDTEIRTTINSAVDTVERFQGQERDLIIAGYVLGNEDAISNEETFIYDNCRLNVIISRAKYKVIILASRELMDNISNDVDVIELQKSFQNIKDYCNEVIDISDPAWKNGKIYRKKI